MSIFGRSGGSKKKAVARKGPAKAGAPASTPEREKLIKEAMRVRSEVREQLGEENIKRMAKAITGRDDF